MKTETIINALIGLAIAGFICTVGLLVIMRKDNPKPDIQKQSTKDTTKIIYDQNCYRCNPDTACNWCSVVKAYSLNVNVYHYGDSVGE